LLDLISLLDFPELKNLLVLVEVDNK
jgi:hypothetical protein